ncbi:MAG: ABC transporter permease, partial [Sulfurimonas sp.]
MKHDFLEIKKEENRLSLIFLDSLTLYTIPKYQEVIKGIDFTPFQTVSFDLKSLDELDSAAVIYLQNIENSLKSTTKTTQISLEKKEHRDLFELVGKKRATKDVELMYHKEGFLEYIGRKTISFFGEFLMFLTFLGEMFTHITLALSNLKTIRYKEIAFEINESAIKALGIVVLTSFLIGVVIAYQAAYQLKMYGANIFIVDMIGITSLRELSPVITAIV